MLHEILKFSYFFWVVFALFYEGMYIPMSIAELRHRVVINNSGRNGGCFYAFMWLYYVWLVVGLFTGQALCFLVILGLALIPKKSPYWIKMDSILTILILLFAIFNAYHLHINLGVVIWTGLTDWIKSL